MNPIRLSANLVWLVVFSVGVTAGAFLSFATGVLFDDSYPVTVTLPEAGGLFPDQEVTVLGDAVGVITGVSVVEEGVRVEMKIQGDESIPRDGTVQVLRRSPIGEQVVDFQPTVPDWEPAEPGDVLAAPDAKIPAEVPFLLEQSAEFLAALDPDSLGTIVHELALALGGRGEALRELGRDTLDLNTTLVSGIPEFERLIDSSESVLAILDDQRETLVHAFGQTANVLDELVEQQPNFERLLDTGVRTVDQLDALNRNERANFQCLTSDLDALNQLLLGPSTATGEPAALYETKLDELEAMLQLQEGFFGGFDIAGQYDAATGARWARILLSDYPAGGQVYPELRPTPATKPGAACETEAFGTGVNAVRQPLHQAPDETSPGIDYAPLVEPRGGGEIDPPDNDGGDRPPLPATGGGIIVLSLAGVAGAAAIRRRR